MASSDRTPFGLRRCDPDETEGRLLYRQMAEAEARRSMAMARRVRLFAPVDPKAGTTDTIDLAREDLPSPKASTSNEG